MKEKLTLYVTPSGEWWFSDEGELPSDFPDDHSVYIVPEDQEPDEFLKTLLKSPQHRVYSGDYAFFSPVLSSPDWARRVSLSLEHWKRRLSDSVSCTGNDGQ